jgi:hypothetical protein
MEQFQCSRVTALMGSGTTMTTPSIRPPVRYTGLGGHPSEAGEIQPVALEANAFPFEEHTLVERRISPQGEFPPGADDPVPGNIRAGRQIVERISNKSCLAGEPAEARNVAVSANFASWYVPHRRPDRVVRIILLAHVRTLCINKTVTPVSCKMAGRRSVERPSGVRAPARQTRQQDLDVVSSRAPAIEPSGLCSYIRDSDDRRGFLTEYLGAAWAGVRGPLHFTGRLMESAGSSFLSQPGVHS